MYAADATRPEIFVVLQFNRVIEIYPRLTLVATVTKIWEF